MNDYTRIADLYDLYVCDTRDHAFWTRHAAAAGGPVLELTAGTGRATVALQAGAAVPVVALDLAPAMLARLEARVAGGPRPVRAVAGDATRLPFAPAHFALVVIPFNSLGEITDTADRVEALREAGRVLAPAGCAIVTLHDPVRRRATLDDTVRALGPFALGDSRLEILVRGRWKTPTIAESEQTYRVLGAHGCLLEERCVRLHFVLPDAASFIAEAEEAGLRTETVFGDYDESPYVPGVSPFIITVLRRESNEYPDRAAGKSAGAR